MRPFDDEFTLEDMDRQLEEATIPSSTLPVEQRNNSNRRLLQDMQRFYQHDEEDTRSLDRVLNRLLERAPEGISAHEGIPVQQEGRDLMHTGNSISKRENKHRTLALIAATLFVALLVGSMVTLFTMARQGQIAHPDNTTTGGTQQATPTPLQSLPQNIYTTVSNTLYKLDGKTHETLWKYQVPANTANGPSILGSPVVSDGSVYIIAANGDMHALNSANGKLLWIAKEGIFIEPVVAEGLVFLKRMESPPNGPYTLFALNASNGKRHITYTLKDANPKEEPFITVVNKVLYVGAGKLLFALNAQDGSEIWHTNLLAEDEHATFVAVEKGILHVTTFQGEFWGSGIKGHFEYGFTIDKLQQKWRHKLQVPDTIPLTNPLMADGIQYYSYESRVFAWNPSQGRLLWDSEKQGVYQNAMFITGGIIYVGVYSSSVKLIALNASTGKILWEKELSGTLAYVRASYVRASNEKVYTIVSPTATAIILQELSIKDGSTLWSNESEIPSDEGSSLTIAP